MLRAYAARPDVCYGLAGQPLPDETRHLATPAPDALAVRLPAPGEAASTLATHRKPYVPQPRNDPPGTIYLRGAAGR